MASIPDLRARARLLFDAAVEAADPAHAVRLGLASCPPAAPDPGGRRVLIAVGKAAPAMLGEAMTAFPGAALSLCVTHHENVASLPGAEIMRAGHPVPDEAGADAARRVISVLEQAEAQDSIVALISGGGSALLPAPPSGITLDEKAQLNELLLAAGFDITQMNLVRQQVSRLKGGGFARLAAPARVNAYILSDVIGDDLRVIASGPTAQPVGTAWQAIALLRDAAVWGRIPASIRLHLERTDNEMPAPFPNVVNSLVGSNRVSLDAMKAAADRMGWAVRIMDDALTGDVEDAARKITADLRAAAQPVVLLYGGETTVTLRGTGRGGRNQELALRVAMAAQDSGRTWVFLSGGTDGRDGPTDAAGGIVDPGSLARIAGAGLDAARLLANNDSHAALSASGDLLKTGATGTNVADVQVLLIAP
ncbi:DUF4147 domain-containing protein [Marivita sp. GX14005]|uniref:glycerate kinase type-2 family protein n=1 Tax=Marivita sp. GX14005 TaxID=2942276 RepID=UPI0020184C06|nr:DUF4147 domain-containing protein [Marivita sp. GX14005]MCL3882344.1 DUF4147 domain-containing protein [Marivita sp. GX14005]